MFSRVYKDIHCQIRCQFYLVCYKGSVTNELYLSCFFSVQSFAYSFPDVAALTDVPYISRYSAVHSTLQTLAPIQSSTSFSQYIFGLHLHWPRSKTAERKTRPYSNVLGTRRREKKQGRPKKTWRSTLKKTWKRWVLAGMEPTRSQVTVREETSRRPSLRQRNRRTYEFFICFIGRSLILQVSISPMFASFYNYVRNNLICAF